MFEDVRSFEALRAAVSSAHSACPSAHTAMLHYTGRLLGPGKYRIPGPTADYMPKGYFLKGPPADMQNQEVKAHLEAAEDVQQTLDTDYATWKSKWDGFPGLVPAVALPHRSAWIAQRR